MLDAAKDNATLLPFDTEFKYGNVKVKRYAWHDDDSRSVAFIGIDDVDYKGSFCEYADASELKPAKKSKPKKWQNGTQAQLDAAKDDARLIPKKAYFLHKEGYFLTRADCEENDATQVLMVAWGAEIPPKMACAADLVPA